MDSRIFKTVDRIENQTVILISQDGEREEAPLGGFGFAVKEGDCVRISDGVYILDAELTKKRAENISERFGRLFKRRKSDE